MSRADSTWYAAGTGRNQSGDHGRTWQASQKLGPGWLPSLCETDRGHLLLFAIYRKGWWPASSSPIWPDDQPYEPSHRGGSWPPDGRVELRLSSDSGKTWSAPQAVPSSEFTLQCRACAAPDGRIWLVSVTSRDASERRTALSLTSSRDGGRTWDSPILLTDGTHFDREPDLVFDRGKLQIAFTRGERGGHTDIWLAEVDPEARPNRSVEVVTRAPVLSGASAVVRSLSPEPHELPEIMSGALDNSDHTVVLYARIDPPVGGVPVHFDVRDASPATIHASLSRQEALTDADGIAQTILKSSNTDTPHYKARVTARVKNGAARNAKSLAVAMLLPDAQYGAPRLHD